MRLIDADALMNTLQELFDKREKEQMFTGSIGAFVTWNDAIFHFKTAPTIDAVPVKHGEWLPKIVNDGYGDLNLFACSECDALSAQDNWKYCRNCGARMDGERKRRWNLNLARFVETQ